MLDRPDEVGSAVRGWLGTMLLAFAKHRLRILGPCRVRTGVGVGLLQLLGRAAGARRGTGARSGPAPPSLRRWRPGR